MRKHIALHYFVVFLAFFLAGCNDNNSSDATSPNRPQPSTNNRTGNTANADSMNSNDATNTRASTKTGDGNFLTKAAQGSMIEAALGRVAILKAQNPEVKNFGQKMIDDHSKAFSEIKVLVEPKNFRLPVEASPEQESLLAKLNDLPSAEFDKAYVDAMVKDHETDIKLFKDEAENGKDADVKEWASKMLPTLQMHFDMIKGIQSKMK